MSQAKAEVDKKLAEKDEEFNHTKKNHARAIESMQATLEVEVKARSDAAKAKKKLESQLADLELQYNIAQKNLQEAAKSHNKMLAAVKDAQDEADAIGVSYAELKDQHSAVERKYTLLFAEYEEIKSSLDANERSRKQAADELLNLTDAHSALNAQYSSLGGAKRKLESDYDTMRAEWEDAIAASKSAENHAKKAIADATKMSEDLSESQNTLLHLEKVKKTLELQNHDLTMKLDDAEAAALKGSKKALAGLQSRYDTLFADYDSQGKMHAELVKQYRKNERKMKEITFQAEEDHKNNSRLQDLVNKLQGKLKQYKFQAEELENQANDNLQKFRRATNDLAASEERADAAEASLARMRSQSQSVGATSTTSASNFSFSIARKSVFQ
jgi:chromosome segregation ATPase